MSFRILTVCTGNICRSPLAEQLLRQELRDVAGIDVSSAGVGALVGDGMPEPARRIAGRLGIPDAADHVARQLSPALLQDADLVLAMSRDHRRAIVEMAPAAMRRVFTVRELAHIIAGIDGEELASEIADAETADDAMRSAVALAAASRGLTPPPEDPDDWDVIDPYRRSDEIYELSARQLVPAAEAVAGYLRRSVAD